MTQQGSTAAATVWQNIAEAADLGHLFLEPEVARQCHDACFRFIDKLNLRIEEAAALTDLKMYGSFTAGTQLADFFSKKAVGGGNSMVEVLKSHIEVVEQMQAVFQKFFVDYDDTDQNNSSSITQAGPN